MVYMKSLPVAPGRRLSRAVGQSEAHMREHCIAGEGNVLYIGLPRSFALEARWGELRSIEWCVVSAVTSAR